MPHTLKRKRTPNPSIVAKCYNCLSKAKKTRTLYWSICGEPTTRYVVAYQYITSARTHPN
jgi:hypothetical protein